MPLNHSITLRPANANDLPAVIAIEQVASPFPWPASAFHDTLFGDHCLALVAHDSDGMLCGYIFSVAIGSELEIHNIAVAPSYRRSHIGELLMTALITTARQHSVNQIYLEVRSKNLPALALYTKLGFTTQLIRRNYYSGDNDDALIMLLSLQDAFLNT